MILFWDELDIELDFLLSINYELSLAPIQALGPNDIFLIVLDELYIF
jgi:hypothetical protein